MCFYYFAQGRINKWSSTRPFIHRNDHIITFMKEALLPDFGIKLQYFQRGVPARFITCWHQTNSSVWCFLLFLKIFIPCAAWFPLQKCDYYQADGENWTAHTVVLCPLFFFLPTLSIFSSSALSRSSRSLLYLQAEHTAVKKLILPCTVNTELGSARCSAYMVMISPHHLWLCLFHHNWIYNFLSVCSLFFSQAFWSHRDGEDALPGDGVCQRR